MMLSHAGVLVGLGVGAGWLLSLWGSQHRCVLAVRVAPHDSWTFVSAAAVLVVVSGIAGWLPAWRASHAEPAVGLRQS